MEGETAIGTMDAARFGAAPTLDEWVDLTRKNTEFWRGVRRSSRVDDEIRDRAARITTPVRLLALSEDWCGDAVNTLPVVARLVEGMPDAQLRVLGREASPDLMNAHLTAGTRSIPIVIVYDAMFTERGWWGPRPSVLQALFQEELRLLAKDERNRQVRTWYARDRGRSTATEVLGLIERCLPSTPTPFRG